MTVVFDPKPDITPWELAKVFACYTGGNFEPVYQESALSRHFRTDDGMSLDYHITVTGGINLNRKIMLTFI